MQPGLRRFSSRPGFCGALLAVLCVAAAATPGHTTTITLRSGNAPIGQPDPNIKFLAEPSGACGVGFAALFTAADFAAAAVGPNANVVSPYSPFWNAALTCDPLAQWIAPDPGKSPRSALFAYTFDVPNPCCFSKATLRLCWSVDDWLGDLDNSTNTGVFLNGTPLAITGGNYAAETHAIADVTTSLHCGVNTLYIYNRDAACVVSGLMFSATIDAVDCFDPAKGSSWGRVKTLYR